MIEPATHDIPLLIQNANYDYGFVIKTIDGVIKDLTGCTVRIELSNINGTFDTLTSGDGLVINPTLGSVIIVLDDSVINTYQQGDIVYKLYITETNNEVNLYLEGRTAVRG